ncbi:glycosyltransferase [Lysinibacillus pakistanensis]|uniref:glycosyltransferase n=1 Tax=Lysinibacillus pakistanensis TaxID=759811 RepID=UPI003D2AACD8
MGDKEILEKCQVKYVDIPFSRSPLSSKNIDAFNALKRLFRQEKFELVHVHTPVASILTRAAFRKSKHGKIINTAHGFHFFKGAPKLNWLIYFIAEKIAAKWTDHLITINEEDYQSAKPSEKI